MKRHIRHNGKPLCGQSGWARTMSRALFLAFRWEDGCRRCAKIAASQAAKKEAK